MPDNYLMHLAVLLSPAVTTSFAVAKAAGKTEAIVTATATASSRVATKNRQAAANTFAATATAAVEQGVVEVFAQSQVSCLPCSHKCVVVQTCTASYSIICFCFELAKVARACVMLAAADRLKHAALDKAACFSLQTATATCNQHVHIVPILSTNMTGHDRMCCCACCLQQAEAFAVSGRAKTVKAYALAVADAINTGGEQVTTAYAQAFASASAGWYTDLESAQRGSCAHSIKHRTTVSVV
jgi:hypothetical protein